MIHAAVWRRSYQICTDSLISKWNVLLDRSSFDGSFLTLPSSIDKAPNVLLSIHLACLSFNCARNTANCSSILFWRSLPPFFVLNDRYCDDWNIFTKIHTSRGHLDLYSLQFVYLMIESFQTIIDIVSIVIMLFFVGINWWTIRFAVIIWRPFQFIAICIQHRWNSSIQ